MCASLLQIYYFYPTQWLKDTTKQPWGLRLSLSLFLSRSGWWRLESLYSTDLQIKTASKDMTWWLPTKKGWYESITQFSKHGHCGRSRTVSGLLVGREKPSENLLGFTYVFFFLFTWQKGRFLPFHCPNDYKGNPQWMSQLSHPSTSSVTASKEVTIFICFQLELFGVDEVTKDSTAFPFCFILHNLYPSEELEDWTKSLTDITRAGPGHLLLSSKIIFANFQKSQSKQTLSLLRVILFI